MKCTIPEISWHNRDPVLSIDIQSTNNLSSSSPCRLATGGADTHVVIWYICIKEKGLASVEVAAELHRHQRAVNTVRFSPSGQYLASGDDESAIIIWKQKTDQDAPELPMNDGESNKEQKEQWITMKILRGHLEDVYDLCWSPDSCFLVSGSIDNTAMMWDVQKGRHTGILSGHTGFVQGVAWDPKNQYIATLSSDRTCRVHNVSTKKLVNKISKAALPVPKDSELSGKVMRLFHDDTLKSFCRRLEFSPDGSLLVTPSGLIETPGTESQINATYIFVRSDFSRPVLYFPSAVQYTVAVRFCPLLFKLREGTSVFDLPYRMVLAVATRCSVLIYDTQQREPIALISNIHYTRLTDLSWSSDARVLVISSTDGYCSIITFSPGELGEEYTPTESPDAVAHASEVKHSSEESGSLNIVAGGSSNCSDEKLKNIKESKADKTTNMNVPRSIPTPAQKDCAITKPSTITSRTTATTPTHQKPIKRITPISIPKDPLSKGKAFNSTASQIESVGKSDSILNIGPNVKEVVSEAKCSDLQHGEPMEIEKEKTNEKTSGEGEPSNAGLIALKNEMPVSKDVTNAVKICDAQKDKPVEEICPNSEHGNGPHKMEDGKDPIASIRSSTQTEEPMEIDSHSNDKNECAQQSRPKLDGDKCSLNEVTLSDKRVAENRSLKVETLSPTRGEQLSKMHETTPSKSHLEAEKSDCIKQGQSPCQSPKNAVTQSPGLPRNVTPIQNRTPRRVQFITLASPKSKKKL